MQTMLFIFNPFAGKDRSRASFSDVVNTFTAAGFLVTTYPTQSAGDATGAISRWGANFDRIVVAGGDGTLNEAVTGLLTLESPPPLGYIPMGSTNDFAKNLHLPSDTLELAHVAATGQPFACDVGLFNERPFVYVAAFGAFADVPFTTPQHTKNLLGYSAYLLESVKRLSSLKPYEITVEHDNGVLEGRFLYGMLSNTVSVGGFSNFPPCDPKLDDGLLELTLIEPPADVLQLERLARTLLLGNAGPDTPLLHSLTSSQVRVQSQEPLVWTLDGENGGAHNRADIAVLPRAFSIVQGAQPALS